MSRREQTSGPTQANLRFSRRLVGYHVAAILLVIGVAAGGLLWISDQHNRLARASAAKMVHGGISSLEEGLAGTVRDYSVWTEALEAIRAGDADWIYSNIGSGAAEIGASDMIVLVEPSGRAYGWQSGSAPEGEPGLLPPDLLRALLDMLDRTEPGEPAVTYGTIDDELWALAAARVVTTEGTAGGLPDAALPRQIHGARIDDALLGEIGADFLIDGLRLGRADAGQSLPLRGADGAPLAHVVWPSPAPGQEILERAALPLAAALLALVIIASALSRFSVRSARRLERALVAAEAASRSKTEFLASVSHELRTPMHGIIGIAQLLETTELDARQREMLAALTQAAEAQTAMIGDLLDISAIESGRRTLELEPFDAAEVLHEVVELARPAGERKGLVLSLRLDGGSPGVVGDPLAFRQVVSNLVDNAVKFTDAGRVDVTVRLSERQGEVACRVAVADTGGGIDPRDHERIFDRFTQADSTLARGAGGAGLGLWISRRLAEMMGGRIVVESARGEGATFIFETAFEASANTGARAEAA